MLKKYLVNGRFFTRKITGVDRFAREILCELDKLVQQGDIEILVPKGTKELPEYKNIKITYFGSMHGILWEQIMLPLYAYFCKMVIINLCNTAPVVKPDMICIHDMQIRANPDFYTKVFVLWYRFLFAATICRAKIIFTVSNFSKKEILKYYHAKEGKIVILYDAWQHMLRIKADNRILDRYPALKDKEYFFAMSSMAKNKNFKWIAETAKLNTDCIFAVAGNVNAKVFGNVELEEIPNVIKLGYVTDEEAKALMKHCRAFLFPTFYEGFGMPPLEALSCGAGVAVSDTVCMREIYGDTPTYIDPNVPVPHIESMVFTQRGNIEKTLNRYSWSAGAQILLTYLTNLWESKE